MNNVFQKIPLSGKLVFVAIVPLIALLFFALDILREKDERINMINNVNREVVIARQYLKTIHEVQMERRKSYFFTVEPNDKGVEMMMQRQKTDDAIKELEKTLAGEQTNFREFTLLNYLSVARARVDARNIEPKFLIEYYSHIIQRMAGSVPSVDNIPVLAPISAELAAQQHITLMLAHLGAAILDMHENQLKKSFTAADISPSLMEYIVFFAQEKEFLSNTSNELRNEYEDLKEKDDVKFIVDYFNSFITGKVTKAESIDPALWAQKNNGTIEEYKRFQLYVTSKAEAAAASIYKQELDAREKTIYALGGILLIVIVLVLFTLRTVNQSLIAIRNAAEKIARGERVPELAVHASDVIGQLTASINAVDRSNGQIAEAADSIGKGHFDVSLIPRSASDLLTNAIIRMQNDLRNFAESTEREIWQKSGLAKIDAAVRGEKDVRSIAADTLKALSSVLDIQHGLFYTTNDNDEFELSGAYADNGVAPLTIPKGAMLTGEAVESGRSVIIRDVNAEHIRISSGLVKAAPSSIAIIPLIHNDSVEGVIEISTLHSFTPEISILLDSAALAISSALHAARNRSRLQELYEETQAQAEELQTQHNELECINTELEAQTQRLQASEEELRAQQEELHHANDELEERARILEEKNQQILLNNLEIQKKAEELALSTRYKSEFLANMSHELRTPLNSILLLSRLLYENQPGSLNKEQEEYARVIQNSGRSLLALIDEILDLSKIESGKMTLDYEKTSVHETVAMLDSMFAPMAREKNIDFNVQVDEEVPVMIETDRMRVEQVLKNLISNALKFTSKGEVKLTVARDAETPGHLLFSVKDTGIGIPKEKQAVIFEAFQQADGSTRRQYGGTGLGLSISRELARLLGGEIRLFSEPGKGSEFCFVVPVEKKVAVADGTNLFKRSVFNSEEEIKYQKPSYRVDQIPAPIPDDSETIGEDDKVILIVEDDTGFVKELQSLIRGKGYKTVCVVRGDEVLEKAERYKPAGILLDIFLPVMDGWQVLEALKGNIKTRHIPVHIMSAREFRKESRLKGAVDFLNKPVNETQLQQVLKRIEEIRAKSSTKVLIIDNQQKHAEALAYYLDTHSIQSEVSYTLDDGLAAARKESVECVILEMSTRSLNTIEVLERIKNENEFSSMPVIVFTGKEITRADVSRLKEFTDTIVLKTAESFRRVLDEVSLFLHVVDRENEKGESVKRKFNALDNVLQGKKVLIADDDVRNIFSLTRALEANQMLVVPATDGRQAIELLEKNPDISLVLMDMMMPEMDGYETTRKIRSDVRFSRLPVIAVTAKAMTGDREKCINAGATDYISKPVDVDQLLSLLRVWLYN